MSTPLARLLKAIHTVPLTIARPLLFWWAAHKRRSGAWRVRPPTREAQETRPEPAIRSLQASIDAVRAMRVELGKVLDARREPSPDLSPPRPLRAQVRQVRAAHDRATAGRPAAPRIARVRGAGAQLVVGQPRRPSFAHGGRARRPLERVFGLDRGEQRPQRPAPRARHRHAVAGRHRRRSRSGRSPTQRPPRRHVALQLGRRRLQLDQRTRLAAGRASGVVLRDGTQRRHENRRDSCVEDRRAVSERSPQAPGRGRRGPLPRVPGDADRLRRRGPCRRPRHVPRTGRCSSATGDARTICRCRTRIAAGRRNRAADDPGVEKGSRLAYAGCPGGTHAPRRRDSHVPALERHHDHPGLALADLSGDARVAGARGDDRPDQGEGGDHPSRSDAAPGRADDDLPGRSHAVRGQRDADARKD